MQNITLETLQDEKLCRICLRKSDVTRPLFTSDEGTGEILSDILIKCASVQLQQDDRLPNGACVQCVELVRKLHGFKRLCDSSNDVLLQLLSKSKESDMQVPYECLEIKTEIKDEVEGEHEAETLNSKTDMEQEDFDINSDELDLDENPYNIVIRKRRCLTIGEKLSIINEMEWGTTNTSICKKYDLSSSTVSGLWKNKDVLRVALEKSRSKSKRLRKCKLDDLDQALYQWCRKQQDSGRLVNGPIFKIKAEQLAHGMGHEGFYCYNGWISRFKQRHNISFTKKRIV